MEVIYAAITFISTGVLVWMLVAGMDHDVDFDTDVDVDADVDFDADVDVDHGGPGPLGVKLILLFLVGFGTMGFVASYFNWNFLGTKVDHLFVAVAGGAASYWLLYQLLKLLYKQQATSQIVGHSIVGRSALVVIAFGKGGVGEINAEDPKTGQTIYMRAQSIDTEAEFKKGDRVKVKAVINGLAQVE